MSKEDNLKYLICVNSACGSLRISGANSLNFLNNLVISDLSSLSVSRFHYSALCNPKGRIINTLWVRINNNESIDIIYPKNMTSLMSYLSMRTFRQKIDIQATELNIFIDIKTHSIELSSSEFEVDTNSGDGLHLYLFQQGLPWIDTNNTELFIPQHVNLDLHEGIMSFSKGCYPGQEIIARIKYLGKIKKRMKLMEFDTQKEAIACVEKTQSLSPIIFNKEIKKFQLQVVENLSK
jgi:folate-binding protein YgfZ